MTFFDYDFKNTQPSLSSSAIIEPTVMLSLCSKDSFPDQGRQSIFLYPDAAIQILNHASLILALKQRRQSQYGPI